MKGNLVMLLKITEKCRMNCDHCMDGAVENCDRMMDKQTFIDSIKFIEKCYTSFGILHLL